MLYFTIKIKHSNIKMKYILISLFLSIVLAASSCNTKGLTEIPMEQFIGNWSLEGRPMFDGIEVQITEENGQFIGRISKLNDNKYNQMFAESNDVWISEISRSSNYQFRLTEKKLARELFALYGLSTSDQYTVEFKDQNTKLLAADGKDPKNATIKYVKVK